MVFLILLVLVVAFGLYVTNFYLLRWFEHAQKVLERRLL